MRTLGGVVPVLPRDAEGRHDFLGDADARARVGRDVDARHAQLARQLGRLGEQLRGVPTPAEQKAHRVSGVSPSRNGTLGGPAYAVLLRAKGADDVRDVVADDDGLPTLRVLGRHELHGPRHHADRVGACEGRLNNQASLR